jgi:hypothetical protein
MDRKVQLGSTARDTITGFTGVVIAITEWLNGCVRITLQPREMKDGKPLENNTFDVQQIEVVEANHYLEPAPAKHATGGPKPEPTRNADPTR